ncbi:hypothetical protein I9W82_001673 [Candida metapsilosis]|uniref:Uncharacterized protein n=1 Tax=Candida metapsilosis TaxID=273372 RepID=A0A8H7ZIJ6_9ASCO|nr:hypothetical protein I9W82_001673 [Candida metapsilosis]
MKTPCEFPARNGGTNPGFVITDPLSELPDIKTLPPNVKHRYNIPVIIFHNKPQGFNSGTILFSDLTKIKQRTSVKDDQTAFVTGLPECKLDEKVFSKDELFTVKLNNTYESYARVFDDFSSTSDVVIARMSFDLAKFNNKCYGGYGNVCRILYKKNLFTEMKGLEREFINFLDRLKRCVSESYYKKLDLKFGFTEFIMTHGVSDEDIDHMSQNPNFLQSQGPSTDLDDDGLNNGGNRGRNSYVVIDGGIAREDSTPIPDYSVTSFSANPPNDQSFTYSEHSASDHANNVSTNVSDFESQLPDSDEEYSDDGDLHVTFETAPMAVPSSDISLSQDIEADMALSRGIGVNNQLQTRNSIRVRQFATIADLKKAHNGITFDESTIFEVGIVKRFTMVPEVPLVITPSGKEAIEFSSFKLYLSDSDLSGDYLVIEFLRRDDLCRFFGIPSSAVKVSGPELQRVEQRFAKLLTQKDTKRVKLKSKTKTANRGLKLKTWCVESTLSQLI